MTPTDALGMALTVIVTVLGLLWLGLYGIEGAWRHVRAAMQGLIEVTRTGASGVARTIWTAYARSSRRD